MKHNDMRDEDARRTWNKKELSREEIGDEQIISINIDYARRYEAAMQLCADLLNFQTYPAVDFDQFKVRYDDLRDSE